MPVRVGIRLMPNPESSVLQTPRPETFSPPSQYQPPTGHKILKPRPNPGR
ncbi:hypothetical protein [Sorlinia euscelidii]